ncbi:alkaline phosphatase D family protein [Candidatus Phycosocius spiralis]|uniref:Alkaline phosphatase n=1 Tax=Candidatus Phycosocius spiralis TaxID=2815099 RepID=A0ABQ4PY78_9PROT|nr:alkaline phosphatase D family protein [Candidatus Phycosocius spiralis]GIU68017.1 alkaline phosphatase [Candidatus Phycosocius spiralis]
MLTRRNTLVALGALPLLSAQKVLAATTVNPFTLGVASGNPKPDSVILWTRLAPDPLKGGGMPVGRALVRYKVCLDVEMTKTFREGQFETSDLDAHSVHVLLDGLQPGHEFFYQFMFGDATSAIGRTRTTSPMDASAKLALASCNAYESGYFAAFADMAAWTPDCVIHVGDYIYEGGIGRLGMNTRLVDGKELSFETVRLHNSPETKSLWDYRNRYALYKTDPDLQAAHAAAPWIVAMDDHEIDNNWAGDIPEDPDQQTSLEFKVRKIAALKAYYEHMPIEKPPMIQGLEASLQMFGLYRFGPAQVHLLDTRQFRSDQPCGQGFPGDTACDAMNDPSLTMTGQAQEAWLFDALKRSNAPFNVLASQTWFAPYRYNAPPEAPRVNMDQWDGYGVQRQRIIDALANGIANPVVLSGDWHSASAMRIHERPYDPRSKRIGHNFCGTSISSHCPWAGALDAAKSYNPHVDYVDGSKRGYIRSTIDRNNWTATYRTVDQPSNPKSKSSTAIEMRTRDL